MNSKEKNNQHNRDISSKTIFDNTVLCAQFLRDNFDLPMLKDIQPGDIEDVSERYYPYLGTELNADSVKRIRIFGIDRETDKEEPPFLVSLIDHKSLVDYDVSMQLLRYMICIWTEYRREKEKENEGCTRRKKFRYPVILPIVYYEGKAQWSANTHFRDRIQNNPEYTKWIPDFEYHVVRIHDYSDRELLEREDEMSLIMLINKIQSIADWERFMRIPPEQMNRILRNSPKHVLDILVSVIESLCFKIGVSTEERTRFVRKVKARNMGYLFENMEKFNIQEERKKAEEQRKRAEKAEEKLRLAEEMIKQLQARSQNSNI